MRRSSPYLVTISASSEPTIERCRSGEARMSSRSAIFASSFVPLGDQFLPLQGGQLAQLHVQDGARLDLVDLQQRHQAGLRDRGRVRPADQGDDLLDPVDGLDQGRDDVQPLLGLAQPEPGPPDDDLDLVRHPVPDHLVQSQRARHSVDQGQHVDAERLLQLGVLVQVVLHDLGDRVPLEHDHKTLAGAPARLVPDVGDASQPPVAHELGDLVGEVVRVDLERAAPWRPGRSAPGSPPRQRRRA